MDRQPGGRHAGDRVRRFQCHPGRLFGRVDGHSISPDPDMPTAFTPLADRNGAVSHPDRPRMDRCIDYIWTSDGIETLASEVCFNRPSPDDPSLWPSDHAGVWADLRI